MNNIKEQVKKKIKEYSKDEYLNGYVRNEFLTDDGNAELLLNIENNKDFFDENTYKNQLDLNEKIYNYIDKKSSMLENDVQLNLQIYSPELEQEIKSKIKHLINEHYAVELYETQKEYKRFKIKIFKLTLVGLLFLGLYSFITFNFSSKFLIEVLSFLFSFTLWEAFETLIYTLSDLKIKREEITQKLIMNIEFKSKNNNQ